MLDIGNAKDKIEIKSEEKFSTSEDTSLQLLKIHDYRGVDWDEANRLKKQFNGTFHINLNDLVFMLYPKGEKV